MHDPRNLAWEDFSTVAGGYSFSSVPVTRVVHNHFSAVRLAFRRCRELSRTRVGLVLPRRVPEKVEKRWVDGRSLTRPT